MTETHKKFIRFVYYAAATTALVAAAVLLMAACITIYRSGPTPYTRASVAAQFDRIDVPVYICLGLVALGFVLRPLLPATPESNKDRDVMVVKRLRSRTDLSLCPAEMAAAIRREQQRQTLHRLITIGLFVVGLAAIVWYGSSFEHYSMEDLNGSMARSMMVFVPAVVIPGAYGVFSLFFNRASYRREIALYRQAPAEAKLTASVTNAKENAWVLVIRYSLLVGAIALIVIGWGMDGWMDVLTKAINICTECVGLG